VLEDSRSRLTDILTLAGGISSTGAETVRILTNRGGKYEKHEINFPALFRGGDPSANIQLENGDTIYVERAPVFYIYGEVQRAGAYRLEANTVVMQALSLGGGLTARATERGIGIHRRMPSGELMMIDAKLTDPIQADDIVFVGSFNLSRSGEENAENVLEIADAALAERMAAFEFVIRSE
jgi:polysaccharide export outer membrane protein